MLKGRLKVFGLGILAGLSIGLGSFLYTLCVSINSKCLGALLFSVGLLLVCLFGLFLYTGKIGFVLQSKNKKLYVLDLFVGILGNLAGAVILGYLLRVIFYNAHYDLILTAIDNIVKTRSPLVTNWTTTLVTSMLCGMLVFLGVFVFKKKWHIAIRIIILVICVFTFVIMGFEHCIANMFYFSFADKWNVYSFLNIIICIVGNSLGALWLSLASNYYLRKGE